jgi:hypothetical protein
VLFKGDDRLVVQRRTFFRTAGGKTFAENKTLTGEGSSPVIKVHIEGKGSNTKLYVKIPAYTGFSIAAANAVCTITSLQIDMRHAFRRLVTVISLCAVL